LSAEWQAICVLKHEDMLIEVPLMLMLLLVHIVNRSKGQYERG
jgi:hypothetical protein